MQYVNIIYFMIISVVKINSDIIFLYLFNRYNSKQIYLEYKYIKMKEIVKIKNMPLLKNL